MSTRAIQAEQLGKRYRIAERQKYRTLRQTITESIPAALRRVRTGGRGEEHIWALRDISFDVGCGEVLGIIGRNGAGKSTLLKLLCRITEPTAGSARIRGRVGSLLEVGTGFHPELTGRENLFLSGAILGMRRAEISRKFDDIVAFAEVDKFIDTPVKHFSSGMYLRLAFAVAAHLEPEILMVDEVLAVGDLSFQRKCLGKMQEVGQSGQTVLFVSHDLTAVSRLAPRSLVLDRGGLVFDGPTEEALRRYTSRGAAPRDDLGTRTDRSGDGVLRMKSLRIYDADGFPVDHVASGDPLTIVITFSAQNHGLLADGVALDLRFTDMLGHPITTLSTRFASRRRSRPLETEGAFVCRIPSFALAQETYGIDGWLAYGGGLADQVIRAGELRVISGRYYDTGAEPVKRKHGAALIQHEWSVEDHDEYEDDTVSTLVGSQGEETKSRDAV